MPSPAALLEVADRVRDGVGLARGLALAEQAGLPQQAHADAPLGALHDAVLAFRAAFAGPELTATAPCPACGTVVEFGLGVDQLRSLRTRSSPQGRTVHDGIEVAWHVPTVADLLAVATEADPGEALRRRCLSASRDGVPVDVDAIPPEQVARVEQEIAAADPLAEVVVALHCPVCATGFDADVDPVGFVARELQVVAERLLREVHELAGAYGWGEAEILALPAPRRAAYLALVRGGAG